jgi:ankyrin repeat protein
MASPKSLHVIIAEDNVEEFQQMVTQDPTILNKPLPKSSDLPIHHASYLGSNRIIRLIVTLHPELLDVQDKWNQSGLLIAADHGHHDTVELFMQLGSTALDTPDENGYTPLHSAVCGGDYKMIELLLELGSKAIDAVTETSLVPMTLSIIIDSPTIIELLIKKGSRFLDFDMIQPDIYRRVPNFYWSESLRTLLALGYDQKLYISYCAANNITSVELFDEDKVAEIRWRVYFERSLVYRCLFDKY